MLKVITDYPVAYDSPDHLVPQGTAFDNTHHKLFVRQTERNFGHKVTHADLGCSGGGLVKDFLDYGHLSIGIEGSDYSLKNQRAEWSKIPDNLFTADITKPFSIVDGDNDQVQLDIITAWEVLEHIPEESLPQLFANIYAHLHDDGIFVGSVSTFADGKYHVTLHEKPWWTEQFAKAGFEPVEGLYEEEHMVRRSNFYMTMKKV